MQTVSRKGRSDSTRLFVFVFRLPPWHSDNASYMNLQNCLLLQTVHVTGDTLTCQQINTISRTYFNAAIEINKQNVKQRLPYNRQRAMCLCPARRSKFGTLPTKIKIKLWYSCFAAALSALAQLANDSIPYPGGTAIID